MKCAILLTLALIACGATGPNGQPPVVEPGTDALDGGASVCLRACGHRKSLGCLEATLESECLPICEKAKAAKLYDPSCAAGATTVSTMLRCGVRCGTP